MNKHGTYVSKCVDFMSSYVTCIFEAGVKIALIKCGGVRNTVYTFSMSYTDSLDIPFSY